MADVNVVATLKTQIFNHTAPGSWSCQRRTYLHYTPNETIGGVEFFWTPRLLPAGG